RTDMNRSLSRLLAGGIVLAAAMSAMGAPALAIIPSANAYIAPNGPQGMAIWAPSTLGFASTTSVTVTSGANELATGSLIVSDQIRALSVEASASSASTLVLTGFLDTTGTNQAWKVTTSIPAASYAWLYAPANEPFQSFRVDVENTAGGTFSAQVLDALGQY
ncbi:MAG: hypothetical protein KGR26_08785, partial [Cyanobacteria bacterium REEB65]|nr:hypothetical protein [Cyanobacteria bacterium REEB65]